MDSLGPGLGGRGMTRAAIRRPHPRDLRGAGAARAGQGRSCCPGPDASAMRSSDGIGFSLECSRCEARKHRVAGELTEGRLHRSRRPVSHRGKRRAGGPYDDALRRLNISTPKPISATSLSGPVALLASPGRKGAFTRLALLEAGYRCAAIRDGELAEESQCFPQGTRGPPVLHRAGRKERRRH